VICTSNFQTFLHTIYKCVLNLVVKMSLIFAQYFDYNAIILMGLFFRGHGVILHLPTVSALIIIIIIIIIMCYASI